MGFDTLYMPPIHPIGTTNRKGPNNSLVAGPNDPGSPYAIGNSAGGHEAIAPELGTLDDFQHFLKVARGHGLELASTLPSRCRPITLGSKSTPNGSIIARTAPLSTRKNPPKKYEDIYPLKLPLGPTGKNLWAAWRDIVLLWAERGVRVFRVDNPHTKPLAFLEWLIRDVQTVYPDTIYLAEAFTRRR